MPPKDEMKNETFELQQNQSEAVSYPRQNDQEARRAQELTAASGRSAVAFF